VSSLLPLLGTGRGEQFRDSGRGSPVTVDLDPAVLVGRVKPEEHPPAPPGAENVPDKIMRPSGRGKDDHPVCVIDGLRGSRVAGEQRLAFGVSGSLPHPRFLSVSLGVPIRQAENLAPAGGRARPAVHQHQVLVRAGR
jgi:hypothetical protein